MARCVDLLLTCSALFASELELLNFSLFAWNSAVHLISCTLQSYYSSAIDFIMTSFGDRFWTLMIGDIVQLQQKLSVM